MDENQTRPSSRRLVIICGLVATAIIGLFVLLPCTLRELGTVSLRGRDISMLKHADSAIRVYQMDVHHYPASLEAPDFQPYIDDSVAAFVRESHVEYHPPAAASPPTFILVHVTTPRGDYSGQLDGTLLYFRKK